MTLEHTLQRNAFFKHGWCRFERDQKVVDWIEKSRDAALHCVNAPEHAQWHRCGGTWFAGVNALPNDPSGAVVRGGALRGQAVDFISNELGFSEFDWDQAQVSVIYPGYPKPMTSEPAAGFRYRSRRDAAHVDGITHRGVDRRRFMGEQHAFILGIPMLRCSANASPLVVWEGSHEIVRETLLTACADLAPAKWQCHDLTEIYQSMRRRVFAECRRVEVAAVPGETTLVHRLALHGVAPWHEAASADPNGRMICYFRPAFLNISDWLNLD